jgi:hypothetical protein
MAGAGAASTWAAPRLLLEAARPIASRMGAAGAASTRAAPRQSLKLPAVCTARYVSSASSPTMHKTMHRNTVARPTSGGGWRVRGHPQASDRSKVIKLAGDVYLQDCM